VRLATALVVLALSPITGCRGGTLAPEPGAEFLAGHQAAARQEAAAATAPSAASAIEERVLQLRETWEEKLRAETASSTDELASPAGRAALEAARGDDFAASLAETVTLERALAGAYVRNPTLQASRRRLVGSVEQFAQVAYLDNVLRQYASFLRASDTRVRPSLPMDSVSKHHPFPGTLELKAAIVSRSVEEAQARYRVVLRQVMADTRSIYADFAYAVRAISISEETLRYLEQIEETARGKLAAGTAGKAHVIQVQVQVAQIANEVITRTRRRDTHRARLCALLDLPAETPLADPTPPTLPRLAHSRAELLERARSEQPDILLARARAERMATMIELAEQGTYPELSAGLSTFEDPSLATGGSQREREPFSTRPKVRPDPFFGSKEAYLRESREGAKAARDLLRAAEDRTAARVTEALNELETAWRLHDLYRDVQLAQARQAYEDAFSAYGVDRAEFMSVIDALRQWLRFRLDAHGAERDIQRAYARLEHAVGASLEAQE